MGRPVTDGFHRSLPRIRLHKSVMDAMNEINRQKRLRDAAVMSPGGTLFFVSKIHFFFSGTLLICKEMEKKPNYVILQNLFFIIRVEGFKSMPALSGKLKLTRLLDFGS